MLPPAANGVMEMAEGCSTVAEKVAGAARKLVAKLVPLTTVAGATENLPETDAG